MKPLRLGFIGGGLDSAVGRAHHSACRMDGLFEVIGGHFSQDWERCRATAEHYNCDAYPTRKDLLEEELDAVVVLTPTPQHYADVDHCLRVGMPVICEKALAVTPEQSANLIRERNQYHGFLAVIYNYTGYPMVRELRSILQKEVLGKIISIQAEMPQEGYLRDGASPQKWRTEDGAIPALHLDLGTHLHHLIYFLTGVKPIRVIAYQQSRSDFNVVDEVQCMADYGDFNAALWFSKVALGHRNGMRIRIYGTEGAAEWHQMSPEELNLSCPDGMRGSMDRSAQVCAVANQPRYQRFKAGHPAGFIEAYANLYHDLYHDLLAHKNGTPQPELASMYSAEIAHEGLVMMSDMVRSAEERRWT